MQTPRIWFSKLIVKDFWKETVPNISEITQHSSAPAFSTEPSTLGFVCVTAAYGLSSNEGAGTGTLVFPEWKSIKQAAVCNTTPVYEE